MRPKFDEWFAAQHGPRVKWPAGSVVGYSDDDLRKIASRGKAAAAELRRRELWDARRESALYAWQVEQRA